MLSYDYCNNEDAGDLGASNAAGASEARGEELSDEHERGLHDDNPQPECLECDEDETPTPFADAAAFPFDAEADRRLTAKEPTPDDLRCGDCWLLPAAHPNAIDRVEICVSCMTSIPDAFDVDPIAVRVIAC